MFPIINTIADLLPHIKNNPQIRVKTEDNGMTVVCYMLQDEDTFAGVEEEYARECRGITFGPDGKIVARTLHKFFNVGEREDTQPHALQWAKVVRIMDKRDGCCDGDTMLETEDGKMSIKDICDSKYSGSVLGFDFTSNTQVFTKIEGHLIQEGSDDWYEIELEDGKTVKLTGNHQVWNSTKRCYVQVQHLQEGDDVQLRA
jgi:hypothetical protein